MESIHNNAVPHFNLRSLLLPLRLVCYRLTHQLFSRS